ncbi:MAG: DNA polymerase III subunit delta [Rhodospirillales bacterium]
MKIATGSADRFVAKPDPKIRAVLIYGPDEGMVGERGRALAKTVCEDLGDAFRVVELSGANFKDDPARLADEVQAISLMGGRRVIRVRPAGDDSVTALANALEAPAGDALIVLEAGDLKKTSKLRKLAEEAGNAAAIACYGDDARGLETLIEQTLGQFGLRADADTAQWLAENLGGDRGVSRKELEKLALYVGPQGDGAKKEIGMAEALAVIGDSAEIGLSDVALAAADGDQKSLDRALDRVFAEGNAAVSVLRALSRHLMTLHQARAAMQGIGDSRGADARSAVERARPPMHFAIKPRVTRQLGVWSAAALGDALALLTEAELQCKTTGMPDTTIVRRAAMRVANAANVARARKRA